ncbi:MAG: hypothetical protein CM15mP77_2620 [Synechococcus sp.]|nr:MAG: hypothetical protein CM15mP77_2620 [Synechococcus sp.]
MPGARSIKTPILRQHPTGRPGDLHWNKPLVLTKEPWEVGGWMASPPGTLFPGRVAATEMIRVSDNSAPNLLIERVVVSRPSPAVGDPRFKPPESTLVSPLEAPTPRCP